MRSLRLLVAAAIVGGTLFAAAPAAHAIFLSKCEPSATGYSCLYGPIPVSNDNEISPVAAPPVPGYVTSMRARLVDENGRRISHHLAHLHHALWLDPTHYDATCDLYPDRFFATGKERTKIEFPAGYGYFWSHDVPLDYEAQPVWLMVTHLHDTHGLGDVDEAYVRLDLGFTPGERGTLIDVKPYWFDVRNCDPDPVFDVPKRPGRHSKFRGTWDYTMPESGRFVTMGGHLHDGGLKLRLRNMTTGADVYQSLPSYDDPDEPWYLTAMSAFSSVDGVSVSEGDQLKLTATYDATHNWDDVMGIMVGYLVPDAAPQAEVVSFNPHLEPRAGRVVAI